MIARPDAGEIAGADGHGRGRRPCRGPFVGIGLWGRREARHALGRERIANLAEPGRPGARLSSAPSARSLAELIRRNTLEATGGRTYAETDPYLDTEGKPTANGSRAAKNELTGQPLENLDHDLRIQSTTLQSALMQGYMAFRVSELTVALGAAFSAAGVGLASAGRR